MLKKLTEVLGARPNGRKFVFPCPICQPTEKRQANWRGEIRPGKVQVAMVACRRCGPEMARMLSLKGQVSTTFLKKGTTKEIEKAWQEVLGSDFVVDASQVMDFDLIHEVYDRMTPTGLLPAHREWLELRGFTWANYTGCGYFSWPLSEVVLKKLIRTYGKRLLGVPGFIEREGEITVNTGSSGAIAIPCNDRHGNTRAIKLRYPKATKSKYRLLSSVPYGPAGVSLCHFPFMGTGFLVPSTIRVVEGERKADLCVARGEGYTIAIPGTGGVRAFVRELETLPNVQTVIIAMDQDEAGRAAAISLAMSLVDKVDVVCEIWDESHKGIDDAILAGADRQIVCDDSWLGEDA